MDVIDIVMADLADLDEIQLLDLSVKCINLALAKIENKEEE